jgi:serine/threonine-protein kinase HipA
LVAWHGDLVGRLTHDGFEWRWKPERRTGPALIRETIPGKLPAFIESLLPEGWLAQVLHERDERDTLRNGRRYMSNIAIVEDRDQRAALPADVLSTPLASFAADGRFTGVYAGPRRGEIEETFEQNLARMFARAETPRLSGVQIKAPMSLTKDGALVPAIDQPFTHILKPAGTAGFDMLPIVEWLCLELGRAAGFETPNAALIAMPDGMPPALVVERFDIRRGPHDQRRLAMEDFCSILDLPTSAKYDGTIERMARALRPLSTDPAADLNILFRRAVFAWLIADGDMHLKNLAVLKIAEPDAKSFTSVRFAPLYDAVTTRVFPGLGSDRMALKLNGKDDRLTRHDFLSLARTIGLPVGEAEEVLGELAARLAERAKTLGLPSFAEKSEGIRIARDKVEAIVIERCLRATG